MKIFRSIFLLIILLLIFVIPCFGSVDPEYYPGEIIVQFKSDVVKFKIKELSASSNDIEIKANSVKNLSIKFKVKKMKDESIKTKVSPGEKWIKGKWVTVPDFSNIYRLVLPEDADVLQAVQEFRKDPNVLAAYPNYIIRYSTVTPNDTYYRDYIPGNLNPGSVNQWNLFNINCGDGWDINKGTSEVVVAVLDTGVRMTHNDISGRTVSGWDFVNGDSDPTDDEGHGSNVASIIAAKTNNSMGLAGVDWNCKIMPVKVLGASGGGSFVDSYKGIVYAADNGADIINMSYGSYVWTTWEAGAVNYAYNTKACILVAAAGNHGLPYPMYPSSYEGVVCVASNDKDDKRSVWNRDVPSESSNYSPRIDVSAPGGGECVDGLYNIIDIGHMVLGISHGSDSGYGLAVGTSQAAPHVSGLAAIILSEFPHLTNDQVVQRIKITADDIDALNPGYAGKLGSGRINVYDALYPLFAEITYPQNNSFIPQGMIQILGTATGEGFATYEVSYRGITTTTWEVIGGSSSAVVDGTLVTWNAGNLWGNKLLKLKVVHTDNTSIETTKNFEIGITDGNKLRTETLNYPNPFDPHQGPTYMRFKTNKKVDSNIFIFDLRGNLIWRMKNGKEENYYPVNGEYRVPWYGRNALNNFVPNGVYIYQIIIGGKVVGHNKMIVFK